MKKISIMTAAVTAAVLTLSACSDVYKRQGIGIRNENKKMSFSDPDIGYGHIPVCLRRQQ